MNSSTRTAVTFLIVGIIAVSFTAYRHNHTPVNLVKNGYLADYKTTTVGNAMAHAFQNGKWTTFKTDNGTTVVQFDGTLPFSKFDSPTLFSEGQPGPAVGDCAKNETCDFLDKKLDQECGADPIDDSKNAPGARACLANAWTQNADYKIPVSIQFTVNADDTFQLSASDTLEGKTLLYLMYD
jgi:hypothetical protein